MENAKKNHTLKPSPDKTPDMQQISAKQDEAQRDQGVYSASSMGELTELTGLLENLSHKLVHLAFLVASMAEEEENEEAKVGDKGVDPFALAHSNPASEVLN